MTGLRAASYTRRRAYKASSAMDGIPFPQAVWTLCQPDNVHNIEEVGSMNETTALPLVIDPDGRWTINSGVESGSACLNPNAWRI